MRVGIYQPGGCPREAHSVSTCGAFLRSLGRASEVPPHCMVGTAQSASDRGESTHSSGLGHPRSCSDACAANGGYLSTMGKDDPTSIGRRKWRMVTSGHDLRADVQAFVAFLSRSIVVHPSYRQLRREAWFATDLQPREPHLVRRHLASGL